MVLNVYRNLIRGGIHPYQLLLMAFLIAFSALEQTHCALVTLRVIVNECCLVVRITECWRAYCR